MCSIGDEGSAALAKALGANPNLLSLDPLDLGINVSRSGQVCAGGSGGGAAGNSNGNGGEGLSGDLSYIEDAL